MIDAHREFRAQAGLDVTNDVLGAAARVREDVDLANVPILGKNTGPFDVPKVPQARLGFLEPVLAGGIHGCVTSVRVCRSASNEATS